MQVCSPTAVHFTIHPSWLLDCPINKYNNKVGQWQSAQRASLSLNSASTLNHGIFPQLFSMPSVHQRRVSSYHLFIELQILSCWNFLCSICLILLTTHAMGWLFSQRSFKFIQGINDAVNVSEAHLIVWIPWTLPEGSLLVLAPCTVKCITPHCPAGPPRTFATTCFVSISSFHYWRFGEMKLASSLFYLLLMGTSIILLNPGNIP